MSEKEQISALVTQIKTALEFAEQRLQDERVGLTPEKVELELGVRVTNKKEAGCKLQWLVSVDVSASSQSQWKQTLTISLTPKKTVNLGDRETEELGDAILALASAAAAASRAGQPSFALNKASLALEIMQGKDGKLQVAAGTSGSSENSHKINLTFRPNV
jgi:Trypsin-co-occurring domain 2